MLTRTKLGIWIVAGWLFTSPIVLHAQPQPSVAQVVIDHLGRQGATPIQLLATAVDSNHPQKNAAPASSGIRRGAPEDGMPGWPSVFEALAASLAWPAIALLALCCFAGPVRTFVSNLKEITLAHSSGSITFVAAFEDILPAVTSRASPSEEVQDRLLSALRPVLEAIERFPVIRGGRFDILWVDDNPRNNINERRSLEKLGVTFETTTSTDEALAKLRRRRFDAVISDMVRPSDPMAGYTLLDKLRAIGNNTPFIIYRGKVEPDEKARGIRMGLADYTNRPDELFNAVARLILRKSRHDPKK